MRAGLGRVLVLNGVFAAAVWAQMASPLTPAEQQQLRESLDALRVAVDTGDLNKVLPKQVDFSLLYSKLRKLHTLTPEQNLEAAELAGRDASGEARFVALVKMAKLAADAGDLLKAERYAQELLALAPAYSRSWNYGNAIHDGNSVLGRVALRRGQKAEANQFLLLAGKTSGSPQLNSFGPNVVLAKELLEKGERDAVLQYFAECKTFWKMDRGRLDQWSATLRGGGVPDLSSQPNY